MKSQSFSIKVFLLSLVLCLPGFAVKAQHAPPELLVRDVGVIGLMSHDIFSWDHKNEINKENGKLDLSTIFDYDGGRRWKKGGDPKNSDNPAVYTAVMDLVDFYRAQLREGFSAQEARIETVAYFHEILRATYERIRQKPFPTEGIDDMPNNVEQSALRGMHDVLPGRIKLFRPLRKELVLTNILTTKTRLNEKELSQPLPPFDGEYAYEFKNIKLPFAKVVLNLQEIDKKFIETFSHLKQAEMLAQLAEVGRNERAIDQVFFIHHIDDLFAKAICPIDNEWMPEMPCR